MSEEEESRSELLAAVLNLIIPPSEDGRMPGAAEYDVLGYLREAAAHLVPVVLDELERLDRRARERSGKRFAELGTEGGQAMIEELRASEPRFLAGLARQTVACYYQQDRVLEAIGMEARPPHPKGYEVHPGDLTLLDPVRRRGRMYRDPGDG